MSARGISIAVVGQGPQAMAVVEAVGKIGGISQVRQLGDMSEALKADVVVEMVGGVELAFKVAMGALGNGMGCIVTSPMLVAAHGRVLQAAELGQHGFLGLSAVGMGVDFAEVLAGYKITGMTMAFAESSNHSLVRMAYRGESVEQAEQHFISQDYDMSDNGGKVTQARALALLGTGSHWWPELTRQSRTGIHGINAELFQSLQGFGLEVVFGAQVAGGYLYSGPLLVAEGHPLAQAPEREVMMVETESGEILLSQSADVQARIVRGVVGDVQRYLRHRSRKLMAAEISQAQVQARCLVVAPYGERESLMTQCAEIMMERIPGDGTWQAVASTQDFAKLRATHPEALVLPLAGAWQAPQSSGLRLVG